MKMMISTNKHSVAHFISFAYLVVSVSVALFTLLKIFYFYSCFFSFLCWSYPNMSFSKLK